MNRRIAILLATCALGLSIAWRSGAITRPQRSAAAAPQLPAPEPPAPEWPPPRPDPRPTPVVPLSARDDRAERLAAALAQIHAEIESWEAHLTGKIENKEAEAAWGRRMHEFDTLITDDNCADIARELSTTELQSPLGTATLRRWLALDPVAATHAIAARPEATNEMACLVADTLIERPADLLDLWRQSPNSPWTQKMLQHAAGAALTIDPRAAIDLAQHLSDAKVRAELLPRIAHHWVQCEPDATLAWIVNFPDRSVRESLVSASAIALANVDPARAAEWLIHGVTDPAALHGALKELIGAWGAQDSDAAAKWADGLTDPELRSTALEIVTNCRAQCVFDPGDPAL